MYQTDDEAYELWRDMVGVPEERIVRIGDNKGAPFASDNWQMADTGPCGRAPRSSMTTATTSPVAQFAG